MTDHQARCITPLLNLLANLQGSSEPAVITRPSARLDSASRGNCRLVAICRWDLAVSVAESLPSCLVILLAGGQDANGFRSNGPRDLPPNLEILSCGLASAQFLPESIAGVLALEPDDSNLQSESSLRTIADWLAPGGVFCIKGKVESRWTSWLPPVLGSASSLRAAARNAGLRDESRTSGPAGLRVFRKPGESALWRIAEEQHGSIAH